jgi:outer membrane protein
MKKNILLLLAIFLSATFTTLAQVKIGYTSATQILPQMPEFKAKQSELESYAKVLENQMKAKQQELQSKATALQQEYDKLVPVVQEQKRKELDQMQQNLMDFQKTAQADIQKKEQALLTPLYDKIQVAITAVSKANNYTLVLNAYDGTNSPNLLYAQESTDITSLVLKEMGIEVKKTEGAE